MRIRSIARRFVLGSFAVLLPAPALAGGTVWYVDAAIADGDGTSWASAFHNVAPAVLTAAFGDEVWVAQGTYEVAMSGLRLKRGVRILGGFVGGETLASEADPVAHPTILSGGVSGPKHIVVGPLAKAGGLAVLEGFVITGGNANDVFPPSDGYGGGMLLEDIGDVHVRRCVFRDNYAMSGGGAVAFDNSEARFVDCVFEDNIGGTSGGVLELMHTGGFITTRVVLDRCVLRGNTAERGGAISVSGGNLQLLNSVVDGNIATGPGGGGGAWATAGGFLFVRNCTIAKNESLVHETAGILGPMNVANSIVYSNTGPLGAQGALNQIGGGIVTVTYSCVAGGYFGAGNIDSPPMFVDESASDFRLRLGSLCIDAGHNDSVLSTGPSLDVSGQPRIADHPAVADVGGGTAPIVDRGAHEAQPLSITRYCFGDGVELACPCGNLAPGGALAGCANTLGVGGTLAGSGEPSLAEDTLVVGAGSLTGSGAASALLVQGTSITQQPFNDGQLCVDGTLVRMGFVPIVGGGASFPGLGQLSLSVRGGVIEPGVRTYQVHYRNALPFCTSATVNQTNGIAVIWTP